MGKIGVGIIGFSEWGSRCLGFDRSPILISKFGGFVIQMRIGWKASVQNIMCRLQRWITKNCFSAMKLTSLGSTRRTPLHAQHCLDALDCGKHIICTKGFVDSLDDAVRVLQRTRETGLKLMVGQTCRFRPDFMHTYRLMEGWQAWQYRRSRSPLCP